ncbi:hypothetical protein BU15DRAFT_47818, partial [Melanogaster broomeanus]
EGAAKADLADDRASEFRQLALQNAAAWYHFAYVHLGRTSVRSNNTLYLITGHHKSSSWFVASFSRAERNIAFSLSFTARPMVNGNAAPAYSRGSEAVTGSLKSRLGPGHGYNRDNPNQTLFVRGYKIAIREGPFVSLLGGRTKVSATLPRPEFDQSCPLNLNGALRRGSSRWGSPCHLEHCRRSRQRCISRSPSTRCRRGARGHNTDIDVHSLLYTKHFVLTRCSPSFV